MIIDFSIQNFRSIKDEVTLSLHVENPKQHLASHVTYPARDKIGVLRSVGIYGANASGKSNILFAFEALRYIACRSGDLKEGKKIPCYEPYRLSELTRNAPVKFELEFFNKDNIRYLYQISFDENVILEESLDFYPARQKANIFKRNEGDTWETISFGGLYKGGTKRIPFFNNNSYLSKAGENAGTPDMVRNVYKYIRSSLVHIGLNDRMMLKDFHENVTLVQRVSTFLCQVDTGVTDIKAKIADVSDDINLPDSISKELKDKILEQRRKTFMFSHKTESGGLEQFKEGDESDGTQKLFSIIPLLIEAFDNGEVLIIDELDSSLHPHIAELIIKLFNDSEINTKNAQLIFSTHNIQLMDSENLRRDQIWFTEKKHNSTSLYSLDEFDKNKVKSDSPFYNWYHEGRFGALPRINYEAIANLLKPIAGKDSVESDS